MIASLSAAPAPEATRARLLVVNGQPAGRRRILDALAGSGHEVVLAATPLEAMTRLAREPFAAMLADHGFVGAGDPDIVARAREVSRVPVIVVSGGEHAPGAVADALRRGAFDFVSDASPDQLRSIVEQALASGGSRGARAIDRIVGGSPQMRKAVELIQSLSRSRCTVLIEGETGTGKELAARAIHQDQSGKTRPFVAVACGALPRELTESLLFGHKRGSFTGALADQKGYFQAAEGGTLFLDDVESLPMEVQSKLIRALQEREITPVGTTKPVKVDVRFVSATNADLRDAVARGLFRQDLYFRLNVVNLRLPPLRERNGDVEELVRHFSERHAREYGVRVRPVEPAAMAALRAHGWPGNVRELDHVIEHVYAVDSCATIGLRCLPESISKVPGGGHDVSGLAPAASTAPPSAAGAALAPEDEQVLTLADSERELVVRALRMTGGNKKQAAEALGLPRQRLYRKIERYRLGNCQFDSREP
ncbi:MAG TPA: sigma-54 dependent transcriptional regulator [Planctomycetota bacterium]|nr:sigma-54 dependent transcriptional regulator [Planctomycetota bacterium]